MIQFITKSIVFLMLSTFSVRAYANYAAASQAFARQDYMRAAPQFFNAYSYAKTRVEKLKSEWGLAESLKAVGLLYSSSKYYSLIVRRGPGPDNPFFQKALVELGKINKALPLGSSHIFQLFKTKMHPSQIPGPARGFVFYYSGLEKYTEKKFNAAAADFQKVPSASPYYGNALFHLGVIANLSGKSSRSIALFEQVLNGLKGENDEIVDATLLNIARVHYEARRYQQALRFYGQIPRDSDSYLEAVWEASYAFFLMENHNAALGAIHTLHSPFFIDRFFPESYVLQAVTFLRLCRENQGKLSLGNFQIRYKPVFSDLRAMRKRYNNNPDDFFKLIYRYQIGQLDGYQKARSIIDKLSRTDDFKIGADTIRFADRELENLNEFTKYWNSTGMIGEFKSFLNSKKKAALVGSGRRLYQKLATYFEYLKDLSDQTLLIDAELEEGKIEKLRRKINIGNSNNRTVEFAGGFEPLKVAETYEYWPFNGEYWEDELGYYVYNINSRCVAEKK